MHVLMAVHFVSVYDFMDHRAHSPGPKQVQQIVLRESRYNHGTREPTRGALETFVHTFCPHTDGAVTTGGFPS